MAQPALPAASSNPRLNAPSWPLRLMAPSGNSTTTWPSLSAAATSLSAVRWARGEMGMAPARRRNPRQYQRE